MSEIVPCLQLEGLNHHPRRRRLTDSKPRRPRSQSFSSRLALSCRHLSHPGVSSALECHRLTTASWHRPSWQSGGCRRRSEALPCHLQSQLAHRCSLRCRALPLSARNCSRSTQTRFRGDHREALLSLRWRNGRTIHRCSYLTGSSSRLAEAIGRQMQSFVVGQLGYSTMTSIREAYLPVACSVGSCH